MSGERAKDERRICVFCGSSRRATAAHLELAHDFGSGVAARGWGVVYGGAAIGLMGAVADAALAGGSTVHGIIPHWLGDAEVAHSGLTELIRVETMHERKARMVAMSDAFVTLPGGFGTLDEFFETTTWAMLALHKKPCAILNAGGYYDPLLAQVENGINSGLIHPNIHGLVIVRKSPEEILDAVSASW